ncbi:MAG: ribose-phosphate diphosphokinase [Cyanobacteria bacterium SZAS TMP-1]|nr:ribose-phosphate diphosphokinase [Cyanobacteria bacterium SZAS TMP-1]
MARKNKPILFATARYEYLKAAMLASGRFEDGIVARGMDDKGAPLVEEKAFADGERYHRLMTDVEHRHVILLGGTIDDRETMELFDLGNLLVDRGALELKIIIPYMGYSTMERAVKPGESVKAKVRARLISAIPKAALGNTVFLVDIHADGVQHYFEGNYQGRSIYAKSVVFDSVKKLLLKRAGIPAVGGDAKARAAALATPFVLASTDAGRAKWVESLTTDLVAMGYKAESAFIIKRRLSGTKTDVRDISADVAGKLVIIYDDMIRTGGSLIKAAQAYRDKGALDVVALATHAVIPGSSCEKLKASGVLSCVLVTDSHPNAVANANDFLVVNSIATLLTDAVLKSRAELV